MEIVLLSLMLAASTAQAKIGWTYGQCVAQWGEETGHICGYNEDMGDKGEEVPLFIFHLHGKHYLEVKFSVIDGLFSYEKSRVIKEWPTEESGF
jgi:hypothetical protein